ncbi:MAG: SxtJ family membrane protein [bacterium]
MNKTLRQFGLTAGLLLGIVSAILFYKGRSIYVGFAVTAAVLATSGLLAPGTLGPIYRAWMAVTWAMTWLNTRLILGAVFYLVLTPIALMSRLFGHDPLSKKIQRKSGSYWQPRAPTEIDAQRMEKLY